MMLARLSLALILAGCASHRPPAPQYPQATPAWTYPPYDDGVEIRNHYMPAPMWMV